MQRNKTQNAIVLSGICNIMNELEKFFIDIAKDHVSKSEQEDYSIKTYIDAPHGFLYTVELCNSRTKTIVIKQVLLNDLLQDCQNNSIAEKWNLIILKMILKSQDIKNEKLTKVDLDF